MNEFFADNGYAQKRRDEILKPFYKMFGFESRFVFMDKGKLSEKLQREAVDTVLQQEENNVITIEEKIVRYPGYTYKHFCLETWSCTVTGREKLGWMVYGQCDYLFYCFTQADRISAIGYLIPFKKLQQWFFENSNFLKYSVTTTNQINHTQCVLTPIQDVLNAVPETQIIILPKP